MPPQGFKSPRVHVVPKKIKIIAQLCYGLSLKGQTRRHLQLPRILMANTTILCQTINLLQLHKDKEDS
jgi:hypothetical protein